MTLHKLLPTYRFATIASVLLMLLLNCAASAQGQEYENPWLPWKVFFKNFYTKPYDVENKSYLEFYGGYSDITTPKVNIKEDFVPTYLIELRYGFIRYDENIQITGMFSHARDYIFISNISSTFKTFDVDQNTDIITDTWRWGLGLENGFGYYDNAGKPLLLLKHNAAFVWTHIDFDGYGSEASREYINIYDENFKFGTLWSAGIDYQATDYLCLSLDYETSIIFPDYKFLNWSGMYLFDNAIQRWPDFFEPTLAPMLGKNWALAKFLYKNFASFITYRMRSNNSFWPIPTDGEIPMTFYSYKIGVSLAL